jgi:hypothetical protein
MHRGQSCRIRTSRPVRQMIHIASCQHQKQKGLRTPLGLCRYTTALMFNWCQPSIHSGSKCFSRIPGVNIGGARYCAVAIANRPRFLVFNIWRRAKGTEEKRQTFSREAPGGSGCVFAIRAPASQESRQVAKFISFIINNLQNEQTNWLASAASLALKGQQINCSPPQNTCSTVRLSSSPDCGSE